MLPLSDFPVKFLRWKIRFFYLRAKLWSQYHKKHLFKNIIIICQFGKRWYTVTN